MSTWVLLRGWAREARHWGDFPRFFAAAVAPEPVLALDLAGTGSHRGERSPLGVPGLVERCRKALAEGGVAPPYSLFGLSLGGMVAMDWAARHSPEVERCVLASTSARPFCAFHARLRWQRYPAILRALVARDAGRREQAILDLVSSNATRRAQALREWTRYAIEAPVSRVNALRQLVAAARYRAPSAPPPLPVLLLAGGGDRLVDPRCSENLARRWKVPLRMHPSAGHDLALDAHAWLAAEVRGWLDRSRSSR